MTNNELYELEELSEPIPVTGTLDLLALASCRAKSVADGRQTEPNAVSGKHLASFAVKSASPPAAKNPLGVLMR